MNHDLHEVVNLVNPDPGGAARIAMVSLPVPLSSSRGGRPPSCLGDLPTQVQPVGWWPPSVAGRRDVVRRQLMFAVSDKALPDSLGVSSGAAAAGSYGGPDVNCRVVEKKNTGYELAEINEARFTGAGKSIGLRMGLIHGGEYHWWQWVRVETLWSGPICRAVRMAGYIEVEHFGDARYDPLNYITKAENLHYHNWLFADVYALLFTNGVVQLTCRHINNHLVDHGRDLEDVLPVIGFTPPSASTIGKTPGGQRTRFDVGGVQLHLDDAASAHGPRRRGVLTSEGDLVVYRPYEGVEIRGDAFHRARDDGYICKAGDGVMPRGVARTLRFALAMHDDPPQISRLVAPDWWYAIANDPWPADILPVHDDSWPATRVAAGREVQEKLDSRPRGFDGGIDTGDWGGEKPYERMLLYYMTGDLRHLEVAINDAYHLADIVFDHATETMRMEHYPFGAIAPPLYRTVGMMFGYLETGDPYLLECCESAANRFYWIDRHNWPRRSYGRDAKSVRSLIFLWDYVQKEDYLGMAREALGRLIACQLPDGSYADQGGGTGLHGSCNEIIKVWMAMMANEAVIDYLMRQPDDEALWRAAVRSGDFVVNALLENGGGHTWAYQYAYGDNPGDPFDMAKNPHDFEPHPRGKLNAVVIQRSAGRFLSVLTRKTGDYKYYEAWQKFVAGLGYELDPQWNSVNLSDQWCARFVDGALHVWPLLTDLSPSISGRIVTPRGELEISCTRDGASIRCRTAGDVDIPVVAHGPDESPPF